MVAPFFGALCGYASGRFFAIPTRRGNPAGVGPVLRRTRKPGGASSSSPATRPAPTATRSASSSTTSRSGSATARGIPGAPPPLPTSTIVPLRRDTSSAPRSESSRSTRRASPTSRIAVSPGVATTPRSHSSSREDDDEPIRLGSLARGLHAAALLEELVHDLALDGRHRLELHALTAVRTLCRGQRDPFERRAAPVAVARRVDRHRLAAAAAPHGRVHH